MLKEVPCWWDSPLDVQKRQSTIENGAIAIEKRKARVVQKRVGKGAMEGVLEGDGKSTKEVDGDTFDVEIVREGFFKRPPRPQGTKITKAKATLLAKRECTLQAQVRAMEKMAIYPALLLEKCPQHHGHKGDPEVTPETCGAIGERAQVILVWVRVLGHWECLPSIGTKSHEG